MPPLNTRTTLRSMSDAMAYIRRMLGEPIVNVELHDVQIEQCVVDAVQLFQQLMHGQGAYEDTIVFNFKAGQKVYPMPDDVIDAVKFSGAQGSNVNKLFSADHQVLMETGILPGVLGSGTMGGSVGMELSTYESSMQYLELFRDFFTKEYMLRYNFLRRELVVEPTPTMDVVGVMAVWKAEAVANCVNHQHVKKLMLAKAKQVWGGIRGKYSIQLPGGGSIEGEGLKSEGKEEEREVIEAMTDEGDNALGFYVG